MADVDASALKVAIDLVHVPSRARLIKSAALPDGMGLLLAIAADDEASLLEGIEVSGRTREVVKGAASFFVEQILMAADCDSYRTLGARDTATNAELRRNMALLLKALHPDLSQNKDRSIFTGRVTRAWEDLKTQERRDSYDSARLLVLARTSPLGTQSGQRPSGQKPLGNKPPGKPTVTTKTRRAKFQFMQNAARTQAGQERAGFWRRTLSYLLRPKSGR